MSEVTLENVIAHFLDAADERVDFVWHGGEPLLAGLDFFKKIPALQAKHNRKGVRVLNNVQTNGTPLTPEFADFFDREAFSVGSSIQGTPEIHDRSRVTAGGGPTWKNVTSKLAQLSSLPSSIVVLTTEILGHEEEVYRSVKPHVRGMRISEYFPGGLIPTRNAAGETKLDDRPEPLMPTPEEFGRSMIRFYEVWKSDPEPIDLRPFTEIIRSFVIGKSESCLYSQDACTHSVVGVKSSGEFYTCIRGAPAQKFSLGHTHEQALSTKETRGSVDRETRIRSLLAGPCGSCEFWSYCNGGCPLESYKLYGDTNHRTWYCEGRKMLFKHILADMRSHAHATPATTEL